MADFETGHPHCQGMRRQRNEMARRKVLQLDLVERKQRAEGIADKSVRLVQGADWSFSVEGWFGILRPL